MQSNPVEATGTGPRSVKLALGFKLTAGFAFLTVLSMGIAGLTLDRMQAMDSATAEVRDNYLPSTMSAATFGMAIGAVRRWEARDMMSLPSDPAERRLASDSLRAAVASVDAARRDYERSIDPGEERQQFNTVFDKMWPEYKQDLQQVAADKDANQEKAARALYFGKSLTDFETLSHFASWDLSYNQKYGVAAGQRSRDVYQSTWWMVVVGSLLVLLLSLFTAFGLIRHIARPIAGMTAAMRRLAERDFGTVIPCVGRGDEIGSMASAVQVFKDNMIKADRLGTEQLAEQKAQQQRSSRLEGLVSDFERQISGTVTILASAATEMEATARSMTGSAAQTDQQAAAVARAAEDSGIGVQTVASASEQLASSITEINRQVTASATLTDKVVVSVRRTDDTVQALAESADRIGHVVALINSIASQTNLLALNATIEAARAGDAGKGFAVVASEVKSLAQQTAKATDEIGGQIAQVQQATNNAVEAIRQISGMIEEVGAITTSIAAAVEEQGAATAEIARNVQQTASSTQTVSSNIAGVSRAANDTGAAATQVLGAAGDLSRQAETLSSEVNSFIAKVRVA